MSDPLSVPATSNTFERIKRVNAAGHEFWSARELARVLEYTDFRNFTAVIAKAREACANSGHTVSDHFVDINEMVSIGCDWKWRSLVAQSCTLLYRRLAVGMTSNMAEA